ncbi:MAG: hypothetical protein JWP69_1611 [Flaviaesturariibacter sp.]|nr:hypothetical protein [Flaviaesturariibacter sp.]
MKKIFFLLIAVWLFLSVQAQEGRQLTKAETVNYLEKKFKETEGLKRRLRLPIASYSEDKAKRSCPIDDFVIALTGCTATISFTNNCSNYTFNSKGYTYKFDPKDIRKIEIYNDSSFVASSPIESLKIYFNGSSVRYTCSDCDTRAIEVMTLPYFKGDGKNFDKIRKAFFHLSSLCKAEDDPFGN